MARINNLRQLLDLIHIDETGALVVSDIKEISRVENNSTQNEDVVPFIMATLPINLEDLK